MDYARLASAGRVKRPLQSLRYSGPHYVGPATADTHDTGYEQTRAEAADAPGMAHPQYNGTPFSSEIGPFIGPCGSVQFLVPL